MKELKAGLHHPSKAAVAAKDQELDDLCNVLNDDLFVSSSDASSAAAAASADDQLKPFAAFGSYRQRHGDATDKNIGHKAAEAPAKLVTIGPSGDGGDGEGHRGHTRASSVPLNIPRSDKSREQGMRRKVLRHRSRSEVEREEAWERKRDQHILEELKGMEENRKARAVGRSVSDCGQRGLSRFNNSGGVVRSSGPERTRSLTDEDLDELRGSIDLGFGFRNQADPKLWNTLPALELCYAINQQYNQSRMASPVSTHDDDGTASEGASSPMSSPSWTISSPGDHPQQVKTRIRHWAQAVACTVRQSAKQEFC